MVQKEASLRENPRISYPRKGSLYKVSFSLDQYSNTIDQITMSDGRRRAHHATPNSRQMARSEPPSQQDKYAIKMKKQLAFTTRAKKHLATYQSAISASKKNPNKDLEYLADLCYEDEGVISHLGALHDKLFAFIDRMNVCQQATFTSLLRQSDILTNLYADRMNTPADCEFEVDYFNDADRNAGPVVPRGEHHLEKRGEEPDSKHDPDEDDTTLLEGWEEILMDDISQSSFEDQATSMERTRKIGKGNLKPATGSTPIFQAHDHQQRSFPGGSIPEAQQVEIESCKNRGNSDYLRPGPALAYSYFSWIQ